VVKYCFLATRALELWTLQALTPDFDFSLGHVAPDDAANAYLALDRGDGSRAVGLLKDYSTSWGRLPAVINLRDAYETYTTQLVDNLLFVHVSDPETLAVLAEGRTARVAVALSVLPASRPEAKLDRVFVSLPGAQSADPRVTVLVEHDGVSLVRRVDGSTARVVLPPRRLPVSAGLSEDELGGLQGDLRQPLWGRSPAASWRFTVEPGAGGVDLSGLTEVLIGLSYQSLLV
jgi:hypothetical protein